MHMITLTDMFGFECFHRNRTEQLMINSLNEQIQYHYNQRMFVWEMMEQVIYDHMCMYYGIGPNRHSSVKTIK